MAEHDADRDDGREPEEGAASADPTASAPDPTSPLDEQAAWEQIVAGYGEEPPDPPGARPFRSVEDLALRESFDFGPEAGSPAGTDEEPGRGTAKKARGSGTEDEDSGGAGGAGKDAFDKGATETTTSGTGASASGTGASAADKDGSDGAGEDAAASAGDRERSKDTGAGPADSGWSGGALGSSVVFAPGRGPRDHSPAEPSDDDFDEDDEGHFVPPEPPELPAADTTAKFAWLGALGGPVLMLLAVLLGWQMTWWLTALSLGGFLGGVVTLVARMRDGDEDDDDPGRGAVV